MTTLTPALLVAAAIVAVSAGSGAKPIPGTDGSKRIEIASECAVHNDGWCSPGIAAPAPNDCDEWTEEPPDWYCT